MIHNKNTYCRGCRCDVCRAANARYQNEWRLSGPRTVNPAPVKAHLLKLRKFGMTNRHIAIAAGVGISTVARVFGKATDPMDVMKKETAAKLLRVTPAIPKTVGLVPSFVVRRKLQALIAIGWTQKDLAKMLGLDLKNMNAIINNGRNKQRVAVRTQQLIDSLYEQLSMTVGLSDRSRELARKKRWLPPLAWDDIEDEKERPNYWGTVHFSVREKPKRKAS